MKNNLIKAELPAGRLLGIDLGTKTIGLAVSSLEHSISTPLETIRRTKFTEDITKFKPVLNEFEVRGFVIGWPLNMDDTEGSACDRVRSFAQEMTQYPDIFGANPWILLWDERLSTEAVGPLVDKSVNKKMKQRGELDALAAHIILQGALDYMTMI